MNDQKKEMLIKLLVQLYNFLRGYHNNVVNVNGINRAVIMQIALCLCCCRHFTDCVSVLSPCCYRISPDGPGYLSAGLCLCHSGLVCVCGSAVHPA